MKYQIAIFDMDGTILDTLQDLYTSVNYVLRQNGFPLRTIDEVRIFVGNGIKKLIERACPINTDENAVNKVYNDFINYYALHCADTTHPYDGIINLLQKLKQNNIKLAVVSNKADFAVKELSKKYFNNLFDLSIGSRDKMKNKPAPDSVFEVLKALNCSSSNAVYIGDSDVDVNTAINANTDFIAVEWGFRTKDFLITHGAKKIANNSEELYNLIMEE